MLVFNNKVLISFSKSWKGLLKLLMFMAFSV